MDIVKILRTHFLHDNLKQNRKETGKNGIAEHYSLCNSVCMASFFNSKVLEVILAETKETVF